MTDKLWINDAALSGIGGWAYTSEDIEADRRARVVVTAGGVELAHQTRTIARPDVDASFPDETGPKGFVLPMDGVVALAALLRGATGEAKWMSLACGAGGRGWISLPTALRDPEALGTLRLAAAAKGPQIADLWFANSHELMLRLALPAGSAGPLVVRVHEVLAEARSPLTLAQEAYLRAGEPMVMAVPLANPFMPLLITIVDGEDELVASDCVPFPSLMRGGLHHAEALAGCDGGLAGLAGYGDALFRAACDRGDDTPPFAICQLRVATDEATGAEPIFTPSALAWLNGFLGFGLAVAGDADAYPADRLAALAVRRRTAAATLTMPPTMLPTLCAVTGRQPQGTGPARTVAAPFIVADALAGRSAWLVGMPALGAWFDALQPDGVVPAGARLETVSGAAIVGARPATPFATQFVDQLPGRSIQLAYPVALDGRVDADDAGDTISVVFQVRAETHRVELLIETLAQQSAAARIELVMVDNGSPRGVVRPIQARIEALFPDRHRIVASEAVAGPAVLINRGVAAATGAFLLIAGSDVVIHDPRTVATLATLAACDEVASSACMLINQVPPSADPLYRSAGYFLDRYDFVGGGLVLSEPEFGPLPPGAWPVAANALDLMMVRRALWDEVGGLDVSYHPDRGGDIDLALRLGAAGRVHLCSTAVSAIVERRRVRTPQTLFRSDVDPVRFEALSRGAAALRRLV